MKIVSPVFYKEMLLLARRRRHYFLRAALIASLLAVVSVTLSQQNSYMQYGGVVDYSYIGVSLFQSFVMFQLFAIVLLVPALTAPVIAAEKDNKTLSLLLMSNLGRYNILLDKLLSRILLVVGLVLSGGPLFIAMLMFGGITLQLIFQAYLSLFSALLFCCGVGLFCSTYLNKMHTAMICSYVAITVYVVTIIFLEIQFQLNDAIMSVLPVGFYSDKISDCVSFLGVSIAVFFLSLLVCANALPRMVDTHQRPWIKTLFQRMNLFFHRINYKGITFCHGNLASTDDAIMWKESHKNFFTSNTFVLRASYALLILSMIALISTGAWVFAMQFFVISALIVVAVIAGIAAATALTSEREKHSFEILMSSPVTAKTIVMAKFMGVVKLVMPILVCIVIWTIIGAASASSVGIHGYQQGMFTRCQPSYRNLPDLLIPPIIDLLIVFFLVFLPMIIVMGLYFSAKQHRNASAIFLTFLYFVGWAALPLPGLFALMKFANSSYERKLIEGILGYVGSLCPVSGSIMICAERSAFCMPLCLSLIVVWILLLRQLITRFDRIIGRQ